MKKKLLILSTNLLVLSFAVSSLSNTVKADEKQSSAYSHIVNAKKDAPSQEFIDKFNNAIVLNSGKFSIDESKLPINSTVEEVDQIKEILAENNSIIQDSISLKDGTSVIDDGNYVSISSSDNGITPRYRNGSNYVHVYWWGLRIGISKSTLSIAIQVGSVIGSVYVPARVAQAALGILGIGAGFIPGGIVFNSTPGLANIWGLEWQ